MKEKPAIAYQNNVFNGFYNLLIFFLHLYDDNLWFQPMVY